MYTKSNVICPNLQGSSEGATCNVFNSFIRDMEDADIRLCMNRRYEACSLYVLSLRRMALNSIGPDVTLETGKNVTET